MNNNWKKKVSANGGRRDDNRGGSNNNSWNRDSKPQMHRATCGDCGESCRVPFKPNGSKPVLCSDCFSGSGDSASRSHSSNKPSYRASGGTNNSEISRQLKALNTKVDRIIKALIDLSDEETSFEDELIDDEDIGSTEDTDEVTEDTDSGNELKFD